MPKVSHDVLQQRQAPPQQTWLPLQGESELIDALELLADLDDRLSKSLGSSGTSSPVGARNGSFKRPNGTRLPDGARLPLPDSYRPPLTDGARLPLPDSYRPPSADNARLPQPPVWGWGAHLNEDDPVEPLGDSMDYLNVGVDGDPNARSRSFHTMPPSRSPVRLRSPSVP